MKIISYFLPKHNKYVRTVSQRRKQLQFSIINTIIYYITNIGIHLSCYIKLRVCRGGRPRPPGLHEI